MKNLALIYFTEDVDKLSKNAFVGVFSKFLKKLLFPGFFRKLKRVFKLKPHLDQKFEVDGNFSIQGMRLPYTLKEFNRLGEASRKRIDKMILKVCNENSINVCILPAICNYSLKSCVKSGFGGRFAYTALLEYILQDLCTKHGLNIREVDIAVVQGEDEVLPYIVIKLLSPVVKFVTLVTKYRELMDGKIEQICDETGLSVRITEDLEGVLKSCDFVINYGNIKLSGIKNKLKSNAIVINYGKLEDAQEELKETVIGGIDIGLGNKYFQGIDKDVFNFYSSTEIAEIVLLNKLDKSINNFHDLIEYISVDSFKKCFMEEGFYIRGYL